MSKINSGKFFTFSILIDQKFFFHTFPDSKRTHTRVRLTCLSDEIITIINMVKCFDLNGKQVVYSLFVKKFFRWLSDSKMCEVTLLLHRIFMCTGTVKCFVLTLFLCCGLLKIKLTQFANCQHKWKLVCKINNKKVSEKEFSCIAEHERFFTYHIYSIVSYRLFFHHFMWLTRGAYAFFSLTYCKF